jgi:hypothetical protein
VPRTFGTGEKRDLARLVLEQSIFIGGLSAACAAESARAAIQSAMHQI